MRSTKQNVKVGGAAGLPKHAARRASNGIRRIQQPLTGFPDQRRQANTAHKWGRAREMGARRVAVDGEDVHPVDLELDCAPGVVQTSVPMRPLAVGRPSAGLAAGSVMTICGCDIGETSIMVQPLRHRHPTVPCGRR